MKQNEKQNYNHSIFDLLNWNFHRPATRFTAFCTNRSNTIDTLKYNPLFFNAGSYFYNLSLVSKIKKEKIDFENRHYLIINLPVEPLQPNHLPLKNRLLKLFSHWQTDRLNFHLPMQNG